MPVTDGAGHPRIDHSFGCWGEGHRTSYRRRTVRRLVVGGVTCVLVAEQRIGADQILPLATGQLVRLLRSWGPGPDHLPGLALIGITVPSRSGPRFLDALVFTPSGVVVIAAQEPGGALEPGSGERAGAGVVAARGALAALGGGRYVTGLVAIVPLSAGSAAAPGEPLSRYDSAADVATVLADPRGLRRIIAQHNRWRTVWSADDVLEACYALSLAHLAPTRVALLAERFPLRLQARTPPPVVPGPEPAAVPPAPGPEVPILPGPVPRPRGQATAVFPRPRPIRLVPWGLVVVLTLLVTVGVVAAVFVAQVFHGT
jgi:hypothetical protein